MNLPSEWMPCLRLMGLLAVEVGLIAVAAAILLKRSRSALWHRAVWQTAIAAVFAVLVLELSGFSRDALAWSGALVNRLASTPSAGALADSGLVADLETRSRSLSLEFQRRVAQQLAESREASGTRPIPEPQQALSAGPTQERGRGDVEPFLQGRATPWPAVVWLIGTGAALGPIWIAWLLFALCHRKWKAPADEALARQVNTLAQQVGLCRKVRCFLSPRLRGPIAFGLLRPTIGLPSDFKDHFSPAQQDAMLTHELAHLAAHDSAWQRLADIVAAILWWHPLAWWIRHRLRVTAEHAADEASVVVHDGPGLLAECLVKLASRAASGPPIGWVQATGPGFRSALGQRIQKLVNLEHRPWLPPNRPRRWVVKTLIPAALVAGTMVCTAWINPPQQGEAMKTMKERWNRSLATLALFATVAVEPGVVGAPSLQTRESRPPEAALAPNATTLIQDGRLLLEMGDLDAAERKLQQALETKPSDPNAEYLLERVLEARLVNEARQGNPAPSGLTPPGAPHETIPVLGDIPMLGRLFRSESQQFAAADNAAPATPPAAKPPPEPEAAPEGEPAVEQPNVYRMDPRLLERYGLKGVRPPAANFRPPGSRGRQQVEAKLNQIVLNEISLDNIPISELVKMLTEEARRRDPEKKGINFLIANVPEEPLVGEMVVDPTTGLPARPMGLANVDIGSLPVKLHLRDVRLRDVLDAITRVAEQPVRYSVQEYGVVISPGPGHAAAYGMTAGTRIPEPTLVVRTFRVDTNTFLPGLANAFGISLSDFSDKPAGAPQVREAVREVLKQLNIEMDPPHKIVAYNYITGIVLVRATPEEMDLIEAAMQTLGGEALRQRPGGRAGGGFGGGGFGGGFGGMSGPAPAGGGAYGGTADGGYGATGGGGMGGAIPQGEKKKF